MTARYASLEELKTYLGIQTSSVDDVDLERALDVGTQIVNGITQRQFAPVAVDAATTTRRYRPRAGTSTLDIDHVLDDAALVVEIDSTFDGTFDTTLTEGVEFTLDHYAGELHPTLGEQWPVGKLYLTDGRRWARPRGRATVRVTGRHGWPATPATVEQSTLILAARYARRPLSPEGVLTQFDTAIRVGYKLDPDACNALGPYRRNPVKV